MKAKVRSHHDFVAIKLALDGIKLLQVIKLICYNIEDDKFGPLTAHQSKKAYYNVRQGRNETNQSYLNRLMSSKQICDQCGSGVGIDELTRRTVYENLKLSPKTTNAAEIATIDEGTTDLVLATSLIAGADNFCFSELKRGLENGTLSGRDEWPTNLTAAYGYLTGYKGVPRSSQKTMVDKDATTFVQNADADPAKEPTKPRKEQEWHKKMTCHKCNQVGHVEFFCGKYKTASTHVQDGEEHKDESQVLGDALLEDVEDDYETNLFFADCMEATTIDMEATTIDIPEGFVQINDATAVMDGDEFFDCESYSDDDDDDVPALEERHYGYNSDDDDSDDDDSMPPLVSRKHGDRDLPDRSQSNQTPGVSVPNDGG
jgi:hypothetical protein